MTQDEVIEMAREADGVFYVTSGNQTPTWYFPHSTIYDFVNLVAAKEREACANLCDELPAPNVYSDSDRGMWDITSLACGDAIRARGEQA